MPGPGQALGEPLIGGDLSSDVVIVRASSLDHDPAALGVDVENRCGDGIPAHVTAQTSVGEPVGDVSLL